MSYHDRAIAHGAETVARMAELDPRDARLVAAFRLYLSGPEGQQAIWNGFAGLLGAHAGRQTMRLFENYLLLVADGARRPLQRHRCGCACVAQDEAALVAVLRCAAYGDDRRAIRTAAIIVDGPWCGRVAMAAGALAEAVDQLEEATARRDDPFRQSCPASLRNAGPARRTLH